MEATWDLTTFRGLSQRRPVRLPWVILRSIRISLKTLMKKIEVKAESSSSGDNTIEIQLAMIKYFFPEAKLLAIRPTFSQKAIELGKEIGQDCKG